MIGVPANDSDEAMRGFVEEFGLDDMLQIVDDDGEIWSRFDVAYQPAWVFVHPDGERELVAGALYDEALFDRIEAFLEDV